MEDSVALSLLSIPLHESAIENDFSLTVPIIFKNPPDRHRPLQYHPELSFCLFPGL
jgi:hypothetical protein